MNKNDVKKVLLINFGGIGDEILFFPTVKSIKQTYPNAKIMTKQAMLVPRGLFSMIVRSVFNEENKRGLWKILEIFWGRNLNDENNAAINE